MRWFRRAFFYFLVLMAGLLLVVFIFGQQIGRYLLRRTITGLGRAISGSVCYESIKGDIFSHPQVSKLLVISGSDTIFINRVTVRYNPLTLLRSKIVLSEVEILEPDIRIAQLGTDKVGGEKRGFRFPNVVIRRLEIRDGRLSLNRKLRADSMGMSLSLTAYGSNLQTNLDSLWCRLVDEEVSVRKLGAAILLNQDSIQVRNLVLMTTASRLRANINLNFTTGKFEINQVELGMNMQEILKVPGGLQLKGWAKKGERGLMVEAAGTASALVFQKMKLPPLSGHFQLLDSMAILKINGEDKELGRANIEAKLNLGNFLFNATVAIETIPVNRFVATSPEFALTATIEVAGRLNSLGVLAKKRTEKLRAPDSVNLRVRGSAQGLGVDTLYAVIDYQGEGVELREVAVSGPVGEFRFKGRVKKDLLVAQCEMSDFDLGVAGRFFRTNLTGRADGLLKLGLSGDSWILNGLVRVNGFGTKGFEVTNGLIQADVVGKDGRQPGIPSQISGRVAVGGEGIKAGGQEWNWAQFVWTGPEFELRLEQDSIQVAALGDLNFEGARLAALIRSMQMVAWEETIRLKDSCEIVLNRDTLKISGAKVDMAEGRVELDLRIPPNTSPEVHLNAQQVNLQRIVRIAGQDIELSGIIGIEVRGSDRLTADFTVKDLKLSSAQIDIKHLTGELLLTQDDITVNYIKFVHHLDTTLIMGIIGYSRHPKFKIKRANLQLNLADPGIWVLSITQPYVEFREGRVYAQTQLQWEPEGLTLLGRGRVNDGVMFVPSVAAEVDRIQAELTFIKDRIVLEKLSGTTTRGILTGEGFAQLNPAWQCESLRYQTHFTKASVIPIPSVYAIGGGDITVSWRQGERVLISGEAIIDDALATMGFGGQSAGREADSSGVNYDIHIKGDRGIWLRNPQADIEFGIDLTVRMVDGEALYSGEMVSRQGAIYYLDHTLHLVEGRLTFDNVNGFDPQLNLIAEAPVSGRRNNGPNKIILKVTGSLQEPLFSFSSEPPVWDETQIISYLSLNVTMDELSVLEQKELLSRLLADRVLGYFQTQVSKRVREYISLDYLEVETGIIGKETAKVTLGKYVTQNLYVSYTQNFTDEFQPAFRIEYYLNRRNELVAERLANGRSSLRYQFKLRF